MNINVRMEGGLGDHLLANRFVPAIIDKYPNAKIKIFSDTEGNERTLNFLLKAFPSFYKRGGEVIMHRNSKTYNVISQFGQENYPAHIDNQTQEYKSKLMDCDIFYDLHIDGLKWIDYDFDWLRYYYFFPKPEFEYYTDNQYILTHLYSRPDSVYNINHRYVISLLHSLARINKTIVIVESEYKSYYQDVFNHPNIVIETPRSIKEIFHIASKCSCFIGIDSGIRYIPYHFSKPTFVFSQYCDVDGNIAISHLSRWLIFSQNIWHMNKSLYEIENIISNIHNNSAYQLFPNINSNIEQYIVQRKFK